MVKIVADSTCDLSKELIEKYQIQIAKRGAPGGCPTSNLYDVATNSPQSHSDDEGSIVSR